MFMTKLRIAEAVLIASALAATDAGVFHSVAADQPIPGGADKQAGKKKTGDEVAPAKFDKLHRRIKLDPKTSAESPCGFARRQAACRRNQGRILDYWVRNSR